MKRLLLLIPAINAPAVYAQTLPDVSVFLSNKSLKTGCKIDASVRLRTVKV